MESRERRERRCFVIGRSCVMVEPASGSGITFLPDGLPPLVFEPQRNAAQARAQARTARLLGYGGDVLRMNAEHDLTHTLLCWLLGLPYSPALADAARGLEENGLSWAEEDAVKAIQRFSNMAGASILGAAERICSH